MKKIFFLAVIFFLVSLFASSENPLMGKDAPEFTVKSGDGKEIGLKDVKGKVVTLFYESKNEIEKNRKLKTELNKFYEKQPEIIQEEVVKLAVVNCKNVFFASAWKSALRENSLKEGFTIYGDWSGKMASAYKASDNDSNFVIIDKHGVIRYYYSGSVGDREIDKIKSLLRQLTKEK
ncbi:MAG: redoxin domain-containing protein [Candidatus Omnitrophota bacterium]|jgi:alkyl hydroperoxide reductase subunit AhpC